MIYLGIPERLIVVPNAYVLFLREQADLSEKGSGSDVFRSLVWSFLLWEDESDFREERSEDW